MIVDDSMVARAVLTRMIEADPAFEIVAVAGTAEDALEALAAVRVDIVLLDLDMPGEGGLKSIPRILDAAAGAKVIIVSSTAEEGAEETVAALALGATDTMPKPGTSRFAGRFSEVLVSKLKAIGFANHQQAASFQPVIAGAQPPLRAMTAGAIDLVAIGASTGGIHALDTLFQHLPRQIGIPILVTQHLPGPFMPIFARQLGATARREALVAEEGMQLLPDRIIIAPGDSHLTVARSGGVPVVHLVQGPVKSGCLPSVDPMLASVGQIFRERALGIILTGMGRDGVEGSSSLVAAGGSVLAQDEATSAVWGMPRAVLEAGFASAVLPPEKIARRVASRVETDPCR
ncbi:chemotaxis-specific protein-glutamate methyltransferase CheB [Sphingomonas piscis]|uniref:protein-glutamate methylesterase n=2 Tax=Sphingomonas piscis TaxID=2714943 RepID=A0A6G7YTN4_9SPHN|nr:chemotaxis-specific protein-glutamate methyltransferase CheB [Sphingomonas piscis]